MFGSANEPLEARLDGKKLGHYRIESLIGRGGTGVVFRARDTHLGRRVAIKVLEENSSRQQEMFQRFVQEARLAAQLSHPNVVTIHEVNQDGQHTFIVMELLDGGSLQDRLDKHGRLDWTTATRFLLNVCRGLNAAHAHGLIHRDIKPGNILIDRSDNIKLGDFGLARRHSTDSTSLTAEGMVIGTPLFMSPEQCEGQTADRRSDIYSLGATFYSLLTGAPPYPGDKPLQVAFAHCSAPLPDPLAVDDTIPERCRDIVQRAMAKRPSDRYQQALEMIADAVRCLESNGSSPAPSLPTIQTEAPNRTRRKPASGRPHRAMWGVGIVLGLAMSLFLIFAISFGDRGPGHGSPEREDVDGSASTADDTASASPDLGSTSDVAFALWPHAEKLAALFAKPTADEVHAALVEWKNTSYLATDWEESEFRPEKMKGVSHLVDGDRHHAMVVYPQEFSENQNYATIVFCHGLGGGGIRREVPALRRRIPASRECILLIPGFRGHALSLIDARRLQSEGEPGDVQAEVTDAMALLDMVSAEISQVDMSRLIAVGTGSRGAVAMQLAVRDDRVDAVIAMEADTDCFQLDIQLANSRAEETGTLPTARLARTVWDEIAKLVLAGSVDLPTARKQLLSLSPSRFVKHLPPIRVYYGAFASDYDIQQAYAFRERYSRDGRWPQFYAFEHFADGPEDWKTIWATQRSTGRFLRGVIEGRLNAPRLPFTVGPTGSSGVRPR